VKDLADQEGRVLITTDTGFLDDPPSSGLLVVRLKAPNSDRIDAAVVRGLKRVRSGRWRGISLEIRDFSIIERQRR
jgi:hypothetical protein